MLLLELAVLLVTGEVATSGGGPVPQVLADLRLEQTCPVWDVKQVILDKVLCPELDITWS